MRVTCPKCGEIQEANRDDLMGCYVVCRKCVLVFSWKKNLQGCSCSKGFHLSAGSQVKKGDPVESGVNHEKP